jgi:cytoskeleton protein RodZ
MTENTSESNERKGREEQGKERYERIGAELRRRREALSLDQGDVAQQLHLPGMVVNDIETGQIDDLSSLYRRGYIRNYARLLELDPDELLAEAGEDVPPVLQEVLPASRGEWRLERYLKIATYALVTVAIVAPLVYVFVDGGTRMLERDPASAESPEVVQAQDEREREAVDSGRASGQPSAESAPSRHVSASALPLNPIRPMRDADSGSAPGAAASPDAEIDPATEPDGPRLTALNLELLEDSWVEIHDAEGTRLEYDLLRSGQNRRYEGHAPFRLLVGRSSAVALQVNGEAVTWEGHESGDVAEIAVSADGTVER